MPVGHQRCRLGRPGRRQDQADRARGEPGLAARHDPHHAAVQSGPARRQFRPRRDRDGAPPRRRGAGFGGHLCRRRRLPAEGRERPRQHRGGEARRPRRRLCRSCFAASAEGDEVVSRAGTFVADGDMVTPVRGEQTGAIQLMGWNFSAWAIRNPVPPILMFIVLLALGLMSFSKLPITRFPNIDVPIVSVTVTDPGVAPSELETQVTKRVEDAVANISGVKNVTSTITEGSSQTVIEFRLEVDTQTAVNDIKDAVERIRSDLPATSEAPVVNRVDVEGPGDPDLCRLGAGDDHRGAFLVRRRHGDPQAAGPEGRRPRRPLWRRHARDQGRARPRPAERARRDRRRRQPRAARGQCRHDRRQRRFQRPRPGDPHARRRQEDRRPRKSWRSRSATAAASTLSEIATITDAWEKPKSFARVNNQTVVSFGIFRGKGQSDVDVNRARRGGGRRAAGGASRRDDQQGRQFGRLHRRQLRFGDGDAARRRGAFGDRGASSSCATSAPRWSRRSRCRCRSSRPSGRST